MLIRLFFIGKGDLEDTSRMQTFEGSSVVLLRLSKIEDLRKRHKLRHLGSLHMQFQIADVLGVYKRCNAVARTVIFCYVFNWKANGHF